MRQLFPLAASLLALIAASGVHAEGRLRFGLDFDVDNLDPARSGSYIERAINASMCDQLMNVSPKLEIVPELATAWEWSPDRLALTLHLRPGVKFQDGAPFDAEVVRRNLDRYRKASYSLRKAELAPITAVEATDPMTVRIKLSHPYTPLVALLANRSGTMLSPRILDKTADEISAHPVCAGPFSFKERVAQDHVTLERFAGYWNAQDVHLDGIDFSIIPDSSVRLVNLQAGALDVANRVSATDVPVIQQAAALKLAQSPSIGFQLLSYNVSNGPAADTPFGQDKRVREAFGKSIDRAALNEVVFGGRFVPNNQFEAPGTPFWDASRPVPERDLAGAKALLAAAGQKRVKLTLLTSNDPVNVQVGEVIQAMAGEAGFDVTVQKGESVAQTQAARRGDYQATLVLWSGRPDPDGNASIWMRCGAPLNWTGVCSKPLDEALARGAETAEHNARMTAYRDAADIWMGERMYTVLYNFTWFWGLSDKVEGFTPRPDGLVRPVGLQLRP